MSGWKMFEWGRIKEILDADRGINAAVEEELQFHIEGKIAELVRLGRSEEEARGEVMERFGDYEQVEAACRRYSTQRVERQGWRSMMDEIGQDVRLGLRTIKRNLGLSGVVALTLAIGIGATTSVFSVVNGVLLRPLPYTDAENLAFIWANDRATGTVREAASTSDYYDFVERSRSFESMAMYGEGSVTLTRDDGEPLRLTAALVNHNLMDVLGVSPQIGRAISPTEDVPDGELVSLLSDRIWRSTFGGDTGVVGQTISLDGRPVVIVGVLPAGLDFPGKDIDVWVPIQQSRVISTRQNHWVQVVGRLASGVTPSQAHAEMASIAAGLEQEYPEANTNRGTFVEPLTEYFRRDLRLTLWVLFGAVFAVLLIGCANVANLLLARGAARAHETAVFAALGAGARRLARRFLVESLIVTTAAGVGGIALAFVGMRVLLAMAPAELLLVGTVTIDGVALGFALIVSAVVGVGFGVLPAIQAARLDVLDQLKEGRTTGGATTSSIRMPLRRLLVSGQIAISVVLMVSAGLLIVTLMNLQSVDPGFRAANTLRMDYQLPESRYPRDFAVYPNWVEVGNFHHELIERVTALPGVESAAITSNHPLQVGFTNSFRVGGRDYDPNQGEMTTRIVTPGYFETVGARLVSGRVMDATDDTNTPPVLIVNQTAAERHFPDGDALGSTVAFWGLPPREVIGIVEDERMHGLDAEAPPAMYANMFQAPLNGGGHTLMVKTSADASSLTASVRETLWSLDRDLAVFNIATMDQTLRDATDRERFVGVVLVAFSAVALFLALLGVHGALSYAVTQRRHEVGIRMALGAGRRQVLRLFISQGMVMTAVGLFFGLVSAAAISRLFESLLFGVEPFDLGAYAIVTVVLGSVTLLASALPARRAARIDPMISLRSE